MNVFYRWAWWKIGSGLLIEIESRPTGIIRSLTERAVFGPINAFVKADT
jgi:hypothetical protein